MFLLYWCVAAVVSWCLPTPSLLLPVVISPVVVSDQDQHASSGGRSLSPISPPSSFPVTFVWVNRKRSGLTCKSEPVSIRALRRVSFTTKQEATLQVAVLAPLLRLCSTARVNTIIVTSGHREALTVKSHSFTGGLFFSALHFIQWLYHFSRGLLYSSSVMFQWKIFKSELQESVFFSVKIRIVHTGGFGLGLFSLFTFRTVKVLPPRKAAEFFTDSLVYHLEKYGCLHVASFTVSDVGRQNAVFVNSNVFILRPAFAYPLYWYLPKLMTRRRILFCPYTDGGLGVNALNPNLLILDCLLGLYGPYGFDKIMGLILEVNWMGLGLSYLVLGILTIMALPPSLYYADVYLASLLVTSTIRESIIGTGLFQRFLYPGRFIPVQRFNSPTERFQTAIERASCGLLKAATHWSTFVKCKGFWFVHLDPIEDFIGVFHCRSMLFEGLSFYNSCIIVACLIVHSIIVWFKYAIAMIVMNLYPTL